METVRSAAATDAELAELWQASIAQRHTVQHRLAAALAAKTALREGIDPDRAADIALVVLAPETYRLLVHHRGWSSRDWEGWAVDTLVRQLLP
ncbi:hypothetical protein IU450_10515 [Nocardia abscessus]|uniref:hypothetical protein n=1 Tax=Nocardia abscessus TaxID=120957 RepID=UPI001894D99F|nr:hypothetical protein [Nocardia abscessus]MBF6336317.1 hypothetical protein [Nocardia abscessus]